MFGALRLRRFYAALLAATVGCALIQFDGSDARAAVKPSFSRAAGAFAEGRSRSSGLTASGSVLYVSGNDNTVTEYSLPSGAVIGTLGSSSGISDPMGLFFADGSLYVTNGNASEVLVFPAGASMPSSILRESTESPFPWDVTVGKDGTVYVVDLMDDYCGEGDFEVFEKGQTTPAYVVYMNSWYSFGAALSKDNYLYVSYVPDQKAKIAVYAPGAQKGHDVNWHLRSDVSGSQTFPMGMVFDKEGNLVVVDVNRIDVFAPGVPKPIRHFGKLISGYFLAFDRDRRILYVADYGANRVKEFDYETGKLVGSIDSSGPVGIAVDPPAPL
jgi:hypothetical protein